eukprot:897049-Prorocentrum_minimum.AAC.1
MAQEALRHGEGHGGEIGGTVHRVRGGDGGARHDEHVRHLVEVGAVEEVPPPVVQPLPPTNNTK